jgi:hypothetical protein
MSQTKTNNVPFLLLLMPYRDVQVTQPLGYVGTLPAIRISLWCARCTARTV